ncbi:MAG: radical SAM protein [Deltaproteobacteria bacterium]|nr:radical SAM protein [Deltaproteobacteria bacterium]
MTRLTDDLSFLAKGSRLLGNVVSGRPFLVNWQITYRCDFACSSCLFWKEPHSAADELTLEQVRLASEKLKPLAPLAISMSGGEPLLREDLPQIARLLSKDHFFSIITNGWHVTAERAARLYEAGLGDVHVSVDYASAAPHDGQRGRPGAFERALRALEIFRDARPSRRHRVHALALLLEDNLDDIERLVLLAEEMGISVELSLYSDRRGRLPRRTPRRPVAEFLRQLKAHHPSSFVPMAGYLDAFDQAVANHGVPSCGAGRTFFNVDEKGNVGLCINELERPVGNLLTDSTATLVAALQQRHHDNPCGACWTSCRGLGDVISGPAGFARSAADFFRAVRPR